MRAQAAQPSFHDAEMAESAGRMVRNGAAWAVGGAALVVGAHALGDGGAPFVLAWGAIAFGLVDLVRGLALRSRLKV